MRKINSGGTKAMQKLNFLKPLFFSIFLTSYVCGQNQTVTVDTPSTNTSEIPFEVIVKKSSLNIPGGIHSFAYGTHDGKWLLITGRTNGMHTFLPTNNFPPKKQNRTVFVVDPSENRVWSRSLEDVDANLAEWQVDLLSVTSAQYLQIKDKLYITGGYGVNSVDGSFSTKPYLTSIDIPLLMKWVMREDRSLFASDAINHLKNEIFQVTGGAMNKIEDGPVLLMVGQNFDGQYTPASNGNYTRQIRRFDIYDQDELSARIYSPVPEEGVDPSLRRRDLNVVPILRNCKGNIKTELDILSGVFTLSGGVWTVPVRVQADGSYFMEDPSSPSSFKQAMNNYACANLGVYDSDSDDMYTLLFGGISYGYFENRQFMTSNSFPFINQFTAVKLDSDNNYKQYLLKSRYPLILSKTANKGNPLLFGAGAAFIYDERALTSQTSDVFLLKKLKSHCPEPRLIGYIVGGIASTLPDTNTGSDSFASPYVFEVYLKNNK